jgi:2-amino-4-hydroxy-6-hydroxymethyldihydropteridine diphosphokinase
MTMTHVYLGIGSNIDRETNIRDGLLEIQSCYGELTLSPVYETEAFGFEGDDFFNLVVGLKTELPIHELAHDLREIEFQFGRSRNETRYSSRTLDVDLLLFGDEANDKYHVPRSDITEFGFVLKPLSDIAPNLKHPVTGETMTQLWNKFDSSREIMRQIPEQFSL